MIYFKPYSMRRIQFNKKKSSKHRVISNKNIVPSNVTLVSIKPLYFLTKMNNSRFDLPTSVITLL